MANVGKRSIAWWEPPLLGTLTVVLLVVAYSGYTDQEWAIMGAACFVATLSGFVGLLAVIARGKQ